MAISAKAALDKLWAVWDYCYVDEENRTIGYRVIKAGTLFGGSIFLMRGFGELMNA